MATVSPEERLLVIYTQLYTSELERREKLSARFPVLMGVYALVVAALVGCLSNLPQDWSNGWTWAFDVLLLFALATLIASFYFAGNFLVFEKYAYVLPAQGIEDYIQSVRDFNVTAQPEFVIDRDSDMTVFLSGQYIEAATINFEENNKRFGAYTRTVQLLVITVALVLLSGIPYFVLKNVKP